ncbi:SLC13 family permease [Desulfitobacterium sp. Sab5]|uniref:SLC13 family permease n=1 Tax=Desulfitobacterium nosdiversum TaxID=3375356 RepID=UPI003CFB9DB3
MAITMAKTPPRSTTKMVPILIAIVIYVIFQFILPPAAPITKAGMGVLGVFLGTLVLWIAVGSAWTSVIGLGMLATTNIANSSTILKESWGNMMVPFLVFCFLLNYAMAETGLSRRIALWFVTRQVLKGKPWLIMGVFFFSVWLISLVLTSSAVVAMYLGIAEQMFKNTGYEPGEDLPEATVSSTAWLAQVGQAMTPLSHAVTLMVLGFIAAGFKINVSVIQFSMVGIAFGIVFFIGFFLVFRYVIRPDVKKMGALDIDYLKSTVPPMGRKEQIVATAFILLVLFWVSPDLLKLIPGLTGLSAFVGALGQCIPVMICIGILSACKYDGEPVLDLPVASGKIKWVTVYMMATLMCFAYVMDLKAGGITAWIQQKTGAMLGGLPALVFIAIVILWILVQTNFMSNTVSAVMYTVVTPIALTITGVNPIALGLCIGMAANLGFSTPAACPVCSMVASTEWVQTSFMMKYGWPMVIVGFISLYCVAYPLFSLMFPF